MTLRTNERKAIIAPAVAAARRRGFHSPDIRWRVQWSAISTHAR
jgi:hypothetical protein